MYDAGKRAFFQQRFRFQPPGGSFHAIAARCHNEIFCRRTITGYAAVNTGLFERDPLMIIMHDHRQRSSSAFQHFQLHDDRHFDHTFFYRLRYFFLTAHSRPPDRIASNQ